MKKPIKRFDEFSPYKTFVNQRDESLEHIFRNHRLKMTDLIDKAFIDAISIIQSKYAGLVDQPYNKTLKNQIDTQIDHVFDGYVSQIVWEQISLRRSAYMISHAGEAEAVARALNKPAKIKLSHDAINLRAYDKLPDGTDIIKRVDAYFSDVRKKMISALELSLIFNDEPDEMLGRVILSLPRKKALPEKPVLKKVKRAKIAEAKRPKFLDEETVGKTVDLGPRGGVRISPFDWDQATWDHAITQSNEDYVFIDRSPETFFDAKNPVTKQRIKSQIPNEDKVYGWELEQQVTSDFVNSVRKGQVDAAKEAGINEFIWIAVLDDRTCEKCCEWRSGLTTGEIKKVLAADKELADHCDVIVPPAHFNCRCGIAPIVLDDNQLTDQSLDAVTKDFDDWLNT